MRVNLRHQKLAHLTSPRDKENTVFTASNLSGNNANEVTYLRLLGERSRTMGSQMKMIDSSKVTIAEKFQIVPFVPVCSVWVRYIHWNQ